MSITKKAISLGMSAALIASLAATIAAPAAFAAITVTSAGNVPVGGTSANTVGFVFTEQAANSLTNAAGSFTVTLGPAGVTFSGTPVLTGTTGSLGASASVTGNVLTISIAGSDTANVESIYVTGLKLSAATGTALGAITATMGGFTGSITSAAQFAGGGTASGTIASGIGIGATSVIVNVTTPSCLFSSAGTLDFATSPESVALTTASASGTPGVGQQTLTIGATGSVHNANEVVSESNGCAASNTLASPGTVVASISYSSDGNATVYPGENNSSADNLYFTEPSAGFLAAASTFTFKILTAGVVFSTAPTVSDNNGAMTLSAPVISADRLSATVTVSTASSAAATITLRNILYDVASTVPAGTFVSVGLTTSAGQAVLPATNTNAVVFRGISATAPSPTVYIGENNQTAGLVTFKESAAGFFTDGVGTGTNYFEICPTGVTYTFTTAPVAMVVGGTAAGNLILRDGSAASTTNIVTGLQNGNCYYWYVWTASTTASTIVIGAAPSAATGPLINVNVSQAPGGVDTQLWVGSSSVDASLFATVQFATAVYRNQVAVTALSQPAIAPGSTSAPAGNLQIAETGLGQLKAGESICVEVLPRSAENTIQDTFLNSLNTANLPIATASGTGLVIGPVTGSNEDCSGNSGNTPGQYMQSFSFPVYQQSTAGDGKVVISNILYTTTADAHTGPVLVSVYGFGGSPTGVIFHSTVSNAFIGTMTPVFVSEASAKGVTQTGPFTIATKVSQKGQYITIKITTSPAMAGAHIGIWVSKKGPDGKWSAFSPHTGRIANGQGVVYYYYKAGSVAWLSFQAHYPGDATHSAALGNAIQARWIS